MGLANPGGTNLGTASGRILIDTSGVHQARQEVQDASRDFERSMARLNSGAQSSQRGIGTLTTGLKGLGAIFGVTFGAAAIAQLGRYAVAVEGVSTAYNRQMVAARSLAGSQAQLNQLLAAYERATGGAIDRATALADVTRLQAVGFADSADELERFVTAARGISIATGQQQDYVINQLQLAIANQSTMRLDQLGLGVSEVKQRIDELKATNKDLTDEMAYQQAILGLAEQKFGALATAMEGQATGVESLRRAWSDFGLELGNIVSGSLSNIGRGIATVVDEATGKLREFQKIQRELNLASPPGGLTIKTTSDGAQQILTNLQAQRTRVLEDMRTGARPQAVLERDLAELDAKIKAANVSLGNFEQAVKAAGIAAYERNRALHPGAPTEIPTTPARRSLNAEQEAVIVDWSRQRSAIERNAYQQSLEATRAYGQQRAATIQQYEQSIAREARDFAVRRQRAEQDHVNAIADIRADALQREQRMAEDLARNIGRAQSDAAERLADLQEDLERTIAQRRADSQERVAEWEEDRDKAIEERRKDSYERIIELEEDFAKNRERRQRELSLSIEEAAARGDGRAVYNLQKRFELEQEEAEKSHQERIAEEKTKLQEAIDQLNEAHRERLADEQKALNKAISQAQDAHNRQVADQKEALDRRIKDAQEAYERQLEDARAADEERIEDMQADFEERKRREDDDRATRLNDLRLDHNAQLAEQDRAHQERIKQIGIQAQNERDKLDEEFAKHLEALDITVDGFAERHQRVIDTAIEEFERWLEAVREGLTGIGPQPSPIENPAFNPRRQQLEAERSKLQSDQAEHEIFSPQWNALESRIKQLETELKKLGWTPPSSPSASAAMGMGNMTGMAAASRFTMPAPVTTAAATGTGGGISLSIGQMVLQGANPNDPRAFADDFNRQLLQALRRAKGA